MLIEGTGAYTTTYSSVGFNGFPPLKSLCDLGAGGVDQRHGVGTGRESELPGLIVGGAPHGLRHVGRGRHKSRLRERREYGWAKGA